MSTPAKLDAIFTGTLNLVGWELYSVKENYVYDEVSIPGLTQKAYKRVIDGNEMSVGVFYYNDVLVYMAWGLKQAEHCGIHAPLSHDGTILEYRLCCPEVRPRFDTSGAVTGFTLDATEAFGTGEVKDKERTSTMRRLLPLITLLGVVLVWATILNWPLLPFVATYHNWMIDFMAGFFLLFGGLKVINLPSFARMYRGYDIIAKRFGAWGYIYGPLEVVLGVLYFTRTELFLTSVATALVMSVATVGVYQKLRSGEESTCACLGGFFKVPVTWLTFAENVAMILMALIMLR